MEIRPVNAHDDPLAISDIYEQSWRYAYRGIVPQAYLDSIPHGRWARRFYERNGFVCADVYLEDTIGGRGVREVMYRYAARP